jgi:hypothetical protein
MGARNISVVIGARIGLDSVCAGSLLSADSRATGSVELEPHD